MSRREASLFPVALVLLAAGPLYHFANQVRQERWFEIGSMDRDFLTEGEEFTPPTMMNGPVRHEDGSVEVIDFYGRISTSRAQLRLPYHALRSPLRLFLRARRFGPRGTVLVSVNGEPPTEFPFEKTSYPWGGIRTIVPQEVAQRGRLRIELVTEGRDLRRRHLGFHLEEPASAFDPIGNSRIPKLGVPARSPFLPGFRIGRTELGGP